jgi:hypothetical protein
MERGECPHGFSFSCPECHVKPREIAQARADVRREVVEASKKADKRIATLTAELAAVKAERDALLGAAINMLKAERDALLGAAINMLKAHMQPLANRPERIANAVRELDAAFVRLYGTDHAKAALAAVED